MKITRVVVEHVMQPIHYVGTDNKTHFLYRRLGKNIWEREMGGSWERVFYTEELERLFQEYIGE